jgi:sugar transferase (PEP-CTERM/EpsH1 system associated)
MRSAHEQCGAGRALLDVNATPQDDKTGLTSLPTNVVPVDGPLRILHVLTHLSRGGMEYGVLKLVKGLDPVLFQHRVCSLRGRDSTAKDFEPLHRDLLVAPQSGFGARCPVLWLARSIRAWRPHVVHSRNWGAIEAIAAARLAGVPVVIHSEHGYEIDMLIGLPWRRRILRRCLYSLANVVFAVTKDLRDFHARQAWTPTKIRVINNGVDTGRFSPDPAARWELRQKFGLSDAFTVGSIGRMVPIKDYDTLLEAIVAVSENGVEVRALLVGDGPELPRLRRRVADCPQLANRVIFVGASDAIPQLLNAMDVFVLPSVHEGMSNTLLEAMATGLPVLATEVGGNPEVMINGRHGWLFPARNVSALANCIYQLATNKAQRQQFGIAARQHAVQQFGLKRMLDSYTQMYCEFVATNRRFRRHL